MILGDSGAFHVLAIPVRSWNPSIMLAALAALPRSLMTRLYRWRAPLILLPRYHNRHDHWQERDHFGKTAKKIRRWHTRS
jgi:hypothetical protein